MNGIYVHIPFCKTKCIYCDFYSIKCNSNIVDKVIKSICKEIHLEKDYFQNKNIDTIYFGGGTPSYLSPIFIDEILKSINSVFNVKSNAEITIEVNPDDITEELLKSYKKININRISMGVQSLNDNVLTFLNRRHNADQALKAIKLIKEFGFTNFSVDFIYGIPNLKLNDLISSLEKIISLQPTHISAYHLTIEKNTKLFKIINESEINEISDVESKKQFLTVSKTLRNANYIHYEVSNFAIKGFESKHNSNYWNNSYYLGLGPSAHSYNGDTRKINTANSQKYSSAIQNDLKYFKVEKLAKKDKFNEYLLTRLRTSKGVNLDEMESLFGKSYSAYFIEKTFLHLKLKNLKLVNKTCYFIPIDKWFISDSIISSLFK